MKRKTLYFTGLGVVILALCFSLYSPHPDHSTSKPLQTPEEKLVLVTNWLNKSRIAWYPLFMLTNQNNVGPEWKELESVNLRIHELKWNLTPSVIQAIRGTEDLDELVRLDHLLDFVSSISLGKRFAGRDISYELNKFKSQLPYLTSNLLREWDSGYFYSEQAIIQAIITLKDERYPRGLVHSGGFTEINYFGIFALPFLIKEINETNNYVHFGAFLLITQSPLFYTQYQHAPEQGFSQVNEKRQFIKSWWSREQTKFNEFHPLYEKIDAAVKALPNLPVETNAVTSGSSP